MERRMLVNYRVDKEALDSLVPEPFRAVEVDDGEGIGGVCLTRIRDARPERLPATFGVSSENSTHRIAVEWDEGGEKRRGVFVPCRHTSSRIAAAASGRLVPGEQKRAGFHVRERPEEYEVRVESDTEYVRVKARESDDMPESSVFESFEEASEFFRNETVGYTACERGVEGVELCFDDADWEMRPLEVLEARSSFFEKLDGSTYDSAFVVSDLSQQIRSPLPAPSP